MEFTLSPVTREEVALRLEAARARTLALLERLTDAELCEQVSPLQSPLVWDLAHIGAYEELWLLGTEHLDERYDAFKQPRAERGGLELMSPAEARAFLADVRGRALDVLERIDFDEESRLLRDGFVFGLVVQHELQHIETMTQTLQIRSSAYDGDLGSPGLVAAAGAYVTVDGGTTSLGAEDEPWAYDNELEAHEVEIGAFDIARSPVTNAEWAEFVAAGGDPPAHWRDGGQVRFGRIEPIPPNEPVCHVSCDQAEAYAAFAGGRLPTEAEWEAAARSGAVVDTGRVWEWTSSEFRAYPGFEAFPYREYSEVFFGPEYRVLRGGSWVTDPLVRRTTFRNWDFPIRSQIFAGVRLAKDVGR